MTSFSKRASPFRPAGIVLVWLTALVFNALLPAEHAEAFGCRSNPPPIGDGTAVLTWEAPANDKYGSSELAGYIIYYGSTPSSLDRVIKLPLEDPALVCRKIESRKAGADGRTECTYVVQGLDQGTHYFSVKAYDTAGTESDFSNKASK